MVEKYPIMNLHSHTRCTTVNFTQVLKVLCIHNETHSQTTTQEIPTNTPLIRFHCSLLLHDTAAFTSSSIT